MGFFNRQPAAEIVPASTIEVATPRYTGEELERMVAETYEEKLVLKQQLESAQRQLKAAKEIRTKLSSAEVFANQCREERDREIKLREAAERERDSLKEAARRKSDSETVLRTQIEKLENDREGCDAEAREKLIDKMIDALIYENGNWSKDRVREFIAGFSEKEGGDK